MYDRVSVRYGEVKAATLQPIEIVIIKSSNHAG